MTQPTKYFASVRHEHVHLFTIEQPTVDRPSGNYSTSYWMATDDPKLLAHTDLDFVAELEQNSLRYSTMQKVGAFYHIRKDIFKVISIHRIADFMYNGMSTLNQEDRNTQSMLERRKNVLLRAAGLRQQESLKYIRNPTDEVIQERLKRDGSEIRFLLDQKDGYCQLAIRQAACNIQHIRNQTKELCKLAIYTSYDDFRTYLAHPDDPGWRTNPTPSRNNPVSLKMIRDQHDDIICLFLAHKKENVNHIKHFKHSVFQILFQHNPNIYKSGIINQYYHKLENTTRRENRDIVEELYKKLIPFDPTIYSIKHVHQEYRSAELAEAAILARPLNFAYVQCSTPELDKLAVQLDYRNIAHIKNPTEDMCIAALKQSYDALQLFSLRTMAIKKAIIVHHAERMEIPTAEEIRALRVKRQLQR